MIEHIVLLKLKEGTTQDQTSALLQGLRDLQEKGSIPGILGVSGGPNSSPEGKGQGFTSTLKLFAKLPTCM